MTNAEIWNQVIYLFTCIGFIYYVINKKMQEDCHKNIHKTKKVVPKTQAKKTHKKETPVANNYIQACWDEVEKL